MKKQVKNENKSIISTIFTEEELKQLDFSEEEIADIEAAEAASPLFDVMPETEKEMDEFFDKFEKMFADEKDPMAIYNKYIELANTDPKFQAQIFAMTFILDQVEEVPEATTEKVLLDEINKEKESVLSDERKAKIAKFDELLRSVKE